jgi:hypothetical protein
MKTTFAVTCILLLLAPGALRAQDGMPPMPTADSVASDWMAHFPDAESRREFKRLREYRADKQMALALEQSKLATLHTIRERVEAESHAREQWRGVLGGLLADSTANGEIVIHQSYPLELDELLGTSTPGTVSAKMVAQAERHLMQLDSAGHQKLADADSVSEVVTASIETINDDLRRAETAIDNALAPEYQSQKFREWVSAFFALLIGLMIFLFFGTIYKKSGEGIGTLLLSDGGLQFVTIFVLIIAIILFGILNILEGRELAAILSGIAGYILGRGAQTRTRAAGESGPRAAPAASSSDVPPAGAPAVRVPSIFVPPPGALASAPEPPPALAEARPAPAQTPELVAAG